MTYPCSGVILAGGLNLRFSGKTKALLSVGGKRILDRIIDVYCQVFEEIILVTNDPASYLEWDMNIVTDLFPVRSPLTGIHAGLFHTRSPYAFFVACDTPFIKKSLVEALIDTIAPRTDAIIPETAQGPQPLFAVYSKRCLSLIQRHLAQQKPNRQHQRSLQPVLKVQRFFEQVRVKKFPESRSREKDPELVSFFNINSPEDMIRAEKIAESIL